MAAAKPAHNPSLALLGGNTPFDAPVLLRGMRMQTEMTGTKTNHPIDVQLHLQRSTVCLRHSNQGVEHASLLSRPGACASAFKAGSRAQLQQLRKLSDAAVSLSVSSSQAASRATHDEAAERRLESNNPTDQHAERPARGRRARAHCFGSLGSAAASISNTPGDGVAERLLFVLSFVIFPPSSGAMKVSKACVAGARRLAPWSILLWWL